MPHSALVTTTSSALPSWLKLELLSPFDAYAQAMAMVMLTIALLQLLCSFYTDARSLRIFGLLYLLTGLGWMFGHPRAHGGPTDVPLLPVLLAVLLLAMNVWALYEFLGLARRRVWHLLAGTVAAGAAIWLWLRLAPGNAVSVYAAMAVAFAYCAWLALQAARLEDNVGHRFIALAYATYPVMFALYVALPSWLAHFEIGYYAAVPAMIVGMMIVAVSLIRSRRRTEVELRRRVAAEDSVRQLNVTLEDRVAARTGELNDLVAGLESFNRSVSHDLRGPLAGMSGLAQLGEMALQRHDLDKAREHLATIDAQATQMVGMVQDLLELSKVSEAPVRRCRHELRHCVDQALGQLRLSAPMAQALQQVRLDVKPLPACEVDADLMRQVFVNLLGNALKFTAARGGDAQVSVGLRSTDAGAAVCVEDNGLGLPAGHEQDLFRPFGRLHGVQVPGHGIGLTIVRRIVEAHGGRIWAESPVAGGARFLFTIDGLVPT
jgi:signal transduction histidine kinase